MTDCGYGAGMDSLPARPFRRIMIDMIKLKKPRDIRRMKKAGQIASEALLAVGDKIAPGVSTYDLDMTARETILKAGAYPAFLGYAGFPASICASINEEVVHGIPSKERVLKEGDIVGIDVGAVYKGYHGDNANTYAVGNIKPTAALLLKTTRESLYCGINALKPNAPLGAYSHAVQTHAESQGFSVVRDYAGHGIGKKLHEPPTVPNYGRPQDGPKLRPGTILAVEPMINEGAPDVESLSDGWTVVTADRKLSAHFEHTVVLLSDGVEILTNWDQTL